MKENFTLSISANIIDSLGISLYKQLPEALEELISNSWDADATKVKISINYKEKEITVSDNGDGMTYQELNQDFLTVYKNRRINGRAYSANKKRAVTGKKGLGKLALFGIANVIEVTSIKNGLVNSFLMDHRKIKKTNSNKQYHPKTILYNQKAGNNERDGTTFVMKDLSIVNIMNINQLSHSLARRFSNYSRKEFLVVLCDEKGNKKEIDENAHLESIKPKDIQATYKFPEDFKREIKKNKALEELKRKKVTGVVYTSVKPLNARDQGFGILVRGKLIGDTLTYQFSNRANDLFYSYSAGYFNMDFIDKDNRTDNISTDRQSVMWENDRKLLNIKEAMQKLINIIGGKWRKERHNKAKEKNKKELDDIFSQSELYKKVISSINFSEKDKRNIDAFREIFGKGEEKVKKEDKKVYFEKILKNSDAYVMDNSVYSDLIPHNFIVPKKINDKIRRIREEAVSLASRMKDKDNYIISEGLLLRAILEATTCEFLIENRENITGLNSLSTKIKNNTHIDDKWICNLPLNTRLYAMIEFLDSKNDFSSRKNLEYYKHEFQSLGIINGLDELMHDPNDFPKFEILKSYWEELCPVFLKAFNYIQK